MKVALSVGAEQDLLDGFEFYEFQQTNLGWYFLDSLYSDIDSLELFAGIHPKRFGDFYWTTSKRFPFSIYYRVVGDTATVIAVLDSRQNPSKTQTRLTAT
jgi:plasmid stabilization system protein ParE